MDNRVKRASGKTGRFVLEIAAAVAVGVGIPLFWVWLGSQIQGSRNAQQVEAGTAMVLIVGILISYTLVLIIAGAIQARGQGEKRPPTRYPWNRSMRDEPYRPGTAKLTPVEAVFVGTAIVASIAMTIWFFAFAGSPLPS